MQTRQFRQDGLEVSAIGLGCWSFAGSYGPTTQDEAHNTLAAAADLGVTLLDTANVYGKGVSENIIGAYLRGRSTGFRVATKAGIMRDATTGERTFNNEISYLRRELEASLKRLRLEHVDLYYMHRRDQSRPIEEVMQTLLQFKSEGKIGGIGFCEIAPASLRRAAAVGPVDAVQSEYSLWTRQPEMGMLQTCKDFGVTFVPYSPLGRGMFAPVAPDPAGFEPGHFRTGTPRFTEPNFSENLRQLEGFRALAAGLDVSTATLAIAWCLSKGPHLIPIPGTRNADHLKECVAAASFDMTDEIMTEIEKALPIGWAHGERYSPATWPGIEHYC